MKVYTLSVRIEEGHDEFWDGLRDQNLSGADEVAKIAKDLFADMGWRDPKCIVKLTKFEDDGIY